MLTAFEFAPEKVRAHGLQDAHPRPLVGARGAGGFKSWRTSPAKAWREQYLEIGNAGSSWAALVFDCDHPGAAKLALYDRDIPQPNWIVTNPATRHFHAAYALANPVHKYEAARLKPLIKLRQISEFYSHALSADQGYVDTLTRNPAPLIPTGDLTKWGRAEGYELAELAEFIPFGWRAPVASTTGIGRNVDLFRDLIRWAGREANAGTAALTAALIRNQEFDVPLPMVEVLATAASVERYRRKWTAHGWHKAAWRAKQAARSAKQTGKPRRASASSVASNEALKPWLADGVARAHMVSRIQCRQHRIVKAVACGRCFEAHMVSPAAGAPRRKHGPNRLGQTFTCCDCGPDSGPKNYRA